MATTPARILLFWRSLLSTSRVKMDSTANSPVCSSQLCEKCKVLSFDDHAAGGFEAVSNDGKNYLKMRHFDKDDRRWILELDYEFRDSLPDFPKLNHSASQGCEFCKILLAAVLPRDPRRTSRDVQPLMAKYASHAVIITLEYIWTYVEDRPSDVPIGIMSLEARLCFVSSVETDTPVVEGRVPFVFLIAGCTGT